MVECLATGDPWHRAADEVLASGRVTATDVRRAPLFDPRDTSISPARHVGSTSDCPAEPPREVDLHVRERFVVEAQPAFSQKSERRSWYSRRAQDTDAEDRLPSAP